MARKAEKTVLVKRGAMGAGIAAGINFLIFFISKGVGISYTVPPRMTEQEPIDLTATGIILSSAVPAMVATILLMILNHYSKKPLQFFVIIAVIVLLLSFAPVFMVDVSVNTKVMLGIMHLVAAGAIIIFLRSAYE